MNLLTSAEKLVFYFSLPRELRRGIENLDDDLTVNQHMDIGMSLTLFFFWKEI